MVVHKGSEVQFTCEVKAPSDSIVYWSLRKNLDEECKVPTLNSTASSDDGLHSCPGKAVGNLTKVSLDETFSLFRIDLMVKCVAA